jgi:large subunit ribosomal protein L16
MLRRYLKRKLKFIRKRKKRKINTRSWILIQSKYSITKKPEEIRMGKGKGAIHNYVYRISSGKIIFESLGLSIYIFKKIFNKIMKKLPIRTIIIKKKLNY